MVDSIYEIGSECVLCGSQLIRSSPGGFGLFHPWSNSNEITNHDYGLYASFTQTLVQASCHSAVLSILYCTLMDSNVLPKMFSISRSHSPIPRG